MNDLTQENRVLINWNLQPKWLKNHLGIRIKLEDGADHQHLATYAFGHLYYDYEEGIKIETTLQDLKEAVKFVNQKMREWWFDLQSEDKTFYLVTASPTYWDANTKNERDQFFLAAGLEPDRSVFALKKFVN